MTCRNVETKLSAFVDSELTGREMFAVRSHLAECESCRVELEALRTVRSLVQDSLETPPLPEGLEARLLSALDAEDRKSARPSPRLVFAGGLVCALALLGFVSMNQKIERDKERQFVEGVERRLRSDIVFVSDGDAISGAPIVTATAYGRR